MIQSRRRWPAVLLLVPIALIACSKSAPVETFAAPPAPGATTTTSVLSNSPIAGYWGSTKYGAMLIRVVGTELWAAYDNRGGTIVGSYVAEDGTWRGWWSQLPSRSPNTDAGEVEFVFPDGPSGNRATGRWRYGTTGAWQSDWLLTRSATTPLPSLVSRFAQTNQFVRHP